MSRPTIYFPDRFVNRHVGGNTVYTRHIKEGIERLGYSTGIIPSGRHPAITMVKESHFGIKSRPNSVLHFSADTGPLLPCRTPSVVTVQGVASRWSSTARNPRQEFIWRTRVAAAIRNCDRVITGSVSSSRDIAEVFDVDISTIEVIPHGIDLAHFTESTKLSQALDELVNPPYILYLGNIEPRKNIGALIQAYRGLGLSQQGYQLVIAGRPAWNYESTLRQIAETPGAIHLGFVSDDDRVALMQAAECFVFPSIYEGFGFPVLEALATGAVVLTTRRGSLAEVAGPSITIDGIDADAVASALSLALTDERVQQQVRNAGREWASQFDWSESIARHASIYEELAAR